ncbi:MAG: class I SAM-dependent methyltransferase [Solirubrobacterales bacterium]|nr:class I SAM-dependent methyltransferase [Solirubrobacterales bacterium]
MRQRLLRRLVSHAHRGQVRALYNRVTWRLYRGSNVRCNCCGTRFRRFRTYIGVGGHRALMCPRCGSLGRHRVDWLYLTERSDALVGPVSLLHIAPEVCLESPLRTLPNVDYLSADYDSTLAMERLDLRNAHYADQTFDGVICNHVLQHIDDDRRAMTELRRILKPGGWALVQSAIDPSLERTVERPEPALAEDDSGRYEEVFMRLYGRDYRSRLAQAGFEVTVSEFAKEMAPALAGELGLDTEETIFFCRRPGSEDGEIASGADPGQPLSEQAISGHDQPK